MMKLRDQMQPDLSHHLHRIVIAKSTIKDKFLKFNVRPN